MLTAATPATPRYQTEYPGEFFFTQNSTVSNNVVLAAYDFDESNSIQSAIDSISSKVSVIDDIEKLKDEIQILKDEIENLKMLLLEN